MTGFHRSMGLGQEMFDGFAKFFKENSLMKRIGHAEDVANLAAFIASQDAINMTGGIYFTDSGSQLFTPQMENA